MPELESFTVNGVELWFNSGDHLPPHFHAEKAGEWEVRILFLRDPEDMVDVRFSFKRGKPNKSDLRELRKLAVEHRSNLLTEWEAKVNVADPGPNR